MAFKCSYCKSPVPKDAKVCEWCGSNDPVDIIKEYGSHENVTVNVQYDAGNKKPSELLNSRSLNIFIQSIKDIKRNYKSSLNRGLFSNISQKIEGVNYSKTKLSLINGFDKELDSQGLEIIIDFADKEISNFEKIKSDKRGNFFNPKSNVYLMDNKILNSWKLLLEKYERKTDDKEIKSKLESLLNNIHQL